MGLLFVLFTNLIHAQSTQPAITFSTGSLQIINVSPQTLQDTSGGAAQTVTITAYNPSDSIGYYQISGSCGSIQFTSPISIQAGSQNSAQVQIQTPYVPIGSSPLTTQCNFKISEIYNPSINASSSFTEITRPLPAGQTSSVVTTTPINAGCRQGYSLNSSGVCMPISQTFTTFQEQFQSGGNSWLITIILFVFVIVIIFMGVIYYIDWKKSNAHKSKSVTNRGLDNGSDESITILKRRYAKGEITKEQYNKMRKDLEE